MQWKSSHVPIQLCMGPASPWPGNVSHFPESSLPVVQDNPSLTAKDQERSSKTLEPQDSKDSLALLLH